MMLYGLRGLGSTVAVQQQIAQVAQQYGVPVPLALAVAKQESGYNQSAIGTSGERGVFQLMPGTAQGLGVDPTDLSQNIDGGIRYLSQLLSKYGDTTVALEAYNGGPGNVDRGTVSSSAQLYARNVMAQANMIVPPVDTYEGGNGGEDTTGQQPGQPDFPTPASPFDGPTAQDVALLAGAGFLLVLALTH